MKTTNLRTLVLTALFAASGPASAQTNSQPAAAKPKPVALAPGVQVLDSHDSPTHADGQAGAVYGQSPPLVNASKPPGAWQTFDILFESPRWNDQGELVKKAVLTVLHNGVVVQHRYELAGGTDGISKVVPYNSATKYPPPHAPRRAAGRDRGMRRQAPHLPGPPRARTARRPPARCAAPGKRGRARVR